MVNVIVEKVVETVNEPLRLMKLLKNNTVSLKLYNKNMKKYF